MKIELNLDQSGKPCISIRHKDKSDELGQKILGTFIDAVKKNGCFLYPVSSTSLGPEGSFSDYEIRIK